MSAISMRIDADTLAQRAGGSWAGPAVANHVTSIEIDSRRCGEGSLFVALPGAQADGHDFISAAADLGAAAALVSRPANDADLPMLVVDDVQHALTGLGAGGREAHIAAGGRLAAITGSVGKTGSKEMLAHLLQPGGCHASRASFNNHLGVPLTLAALPETPVDAVQEIGMNAPGEISALSAIAQPDIAVITRIADSHAGFFDCLDDIADAKAEIFDGLRADGTAILNHDDAYFDRLSARARDAGAAKIISFGTSDGADFRLVSAERHTDGMRVNAQARGTSLSFDLGMHGAHWAINAMAMLAVCDSFGHDAAIAAERLASFTNLPGRGAVSSGTFDGTAITLIDDSYNAGPASMKAAFASLAANPPQIMVLSEMLELGDGSASAHTALAPGIMSLRPRVVITIGTEMSRMAAALPCTAVHEPAADAEAATDRLRAHLRDGDTVFIKGSNGSGAWRVAAALIEALRNGGASDEGETHDAA
ncbi:MAG: UDP-N-acetylmuramoyl-tripeptide--D-alanyl-D-alanine ligase [Pseudomonadota bacterium]|nr:UDP-N-acetylmuramoyl-tripeptide--D-alanyl-D-alanine ligase [Pseudomonadota bacterium]